MASNALTSFPQAPGPNLVPFRLTTWNSQGNPLAKTASGFEKSVVVGKFFTAQATNVVFLQEGGSSIVNFDPFLQTCAVYAGEGVGTFNDRCTPYLMTDNAQSQPVSLTTKSNGVIMAGGEAGRTGVAFAIGTALFISWHGTANNATGSTGDLITALFTNPVYPQHYNTIVIGGDFNVSPGDMESWLNQWTGRNGNTPYNLRPKATPYDAGVYASSTGTQGGANKDLRELDYFIVMVKPAGTQFQVTGGPEVIPVSPSDHNPVAMDCVLQL